MTRFVLLTLLCSCLSAKLLVPSAFARNSLSQPVVLAAISNNPQKHIEYGQSLADYLTLKITGTNQRGQVKIASSLPELIQWFNNDEIDLATETVFAALKIQSDAKVEFTARRWKKGVAKYSSVFITHKDSGITNLQDLVGQRVIFEDPGSSSGYFIPAAMLIEAGMKLHQISSISSPIPSGAVGYLFANHQLNTSTEINITAWVFQKRAAAGAYSRGDWLDPIAAPQSMKKRLKIFHSSGYFPRSIMMLRSNLPHETKSHIQKTLFEAHENDEGISALAKYQRTEKFDALGTESMESIERAKQLLTIIESEHLSP